MTVASTPRGHDNVGPLAKRTNGCATASRQVFEDLFRLAQESFLNPDRDSGARLLTGKAAVAEWADCVYALKTAQQIEKQSPWPEDGQMGSNPQRKARRGTDLHSLRNRAFTLKTSVTKVNEC